MKPLRQSAATAPPPTEQALLRPLPEVLAAARRKAESDVLRFRTCCADPRASK